MVFGFVSGRRAVRGSRSAGRRRRQSHEIQSLEVRQLLTGDAVLQWNAVLLDAIREDGTSPPAASRSMAIMHTAIYDAVNSISRTQHPYVILMDVHPRASQEAAAVAAAHTTLSALFPAQRDSFDAALGQWNVQPFHNPRETDGWNLGRAVADHLLALRANDGSGNTVTYTTGDQTGEWRPAPPGLAAPLLPGWGAVQLWSTVDVTQFHPGPPPSVSSEQYANELNEVKDLGSADSTIRTAEQSDIARFWSNGPGTATPPGHWNVVAQIVAREQQQDLLQNATLFAQLNMALADAAVACWYTKYEYDFWRPITAIHEADHDGNSATAGDPEWSSLLITPPFPAYSSGHSTFSGAAAAVLQTHFGTDDIPFVLPSEAESVSDRAFDGFTHAAEESGMSRIYGGIHFASDNIAGLAAGDLIGNHIAQHLLQPAAAAAAARLADGQLYVHGTADAEVIRISQRRGVLKVTINRKVLERFSASLVSQIIVDAGAGNDFVSLNGVRVSSEIYGGPGNDTLIGGRGDDRIHGEGGNDRLYGGPGNDLLDGGTERNILRGGPGRDTMIGVRGIDRLFGSRRIDELLWHDTVS